MSQPFLEVLTRVYKRPELLTVNRASLAMQTDPDWWQTLLVDELGRGVGWSYQNMAKYSNSLKGKYIWILDDDDECILPDFVANLKAVVNAVESPDVVMVRMDHGDGRILPDECWQRRPVLGGIGVSAFVVKKELWRKHAWVMNPGHYASDFTFIYSIWQSRPKVLWWDTVASRVQKKSFGQPS